MRARDKVMLAHHHVQGQQISVAARPSACPHACPLRCRLLYILHGVHNLHAFRFVWWNELAFCVVRAPHLQIVDHSHQRAVAISQGLAITNPQGRPTRRAGQAAAEALRTEDVVAHRLQGLVHDTHADAALELLRNAPRVRVH
eukprot:CAMPEP_0177296282 /NCGR_PEP_ID=MMETSP0368-20130122/2341_1 /TAXON_ID=447022 ORGANISM="Scrippsiella hangoei-like, Strain SHHI-4" /NCGR_SAMPLE_ID=MMETSP0368 /ASSEMBLY_ACC=CAM_ASM_000363 /LENGTH=142 /DNA_ID=CAMNT_0018754401 /DNA_START=541 /DNA_END=966 /DNA_ORIENTATION=+